jgi:hypothetical protein
VVGNLLHDARKTDDGAVCILGPILIFFDRVYLHEIHGGLKCCLFGLSNLMLSLHREVWSKLGGCFAMGVWADGLLPLSGTIDVAAVKSFCAQTPNRCPG